MTFADAGAAPVPLYIIGKAQLDAWVSGQPAAVGAWLRTTGFTGDTGQARLVADAQGRALLAVAGFGDGASRKRGRFHLAASAENLPEGVYRLAGDLSEVDLEEAALGWLLAGYRFGRYRDQGGLKARLVAPDGVDARRLETIAAGEALTRDLINTPSNDMGPQELEVAFRELAMTHNAGVSVIGGDDLLAQNLPMIHAVGRASTRAPRLLDMRWGTAGPRLTLVGKGVCFDTGGLNIKPGGSMGLMKKDMGGAAAVMGLVHMIMATGLKLRLRVLVPAVENAIGGSAFRPGDILTSRKGLTVEINNTDAEGRLVLADALALADEEPVDCLISMATLTGAARVAVGPDLAPYFTDDDALAGALKSAGDTVCDPLWQLPFWDPYESMIEPGIADLDNAPKGGFAGTITAALFLRRFVEQAPRYAHFDIYGWQPASAPARPKGGTGQGTRAILAALPGVLGL
jgi:leucyl aminopeptidase